MMRERLGCVHAPELLVHVHGVEQRLVEPGLKLVGDDEKAAIEWTTSRGVMKPAM